MPDLVTLDPTSLSYNLDNTALAYPTFNVNGALATDLYSVTSTLPETSTEDATAAVERIERQRNTLQVAQANLRLNSDSIKTGTLYQKFIGDTIDYSTAVVGNRTKEVGYRTSLVKLDIANLKLQMTDERRLQEAVNLQGTRELTPLIQEKWALKRRKLTADIGKLRADVEQAMAELSSYTPTLSVEAE